MMFVHGLLLFTLQAPSPFPSELEGTPPLLGFESLRIDADYISEGVAVDDVNRDGHLDVISGVRWYEGPEFKRVHQILPVGPFLITLYSDVFHTFSDDLDQDGAPDVIVQTFPGGPCFWLENPSGLGAWIPHAIFPGVNGEHPQFVDIDGDGVRELIFASQGALGFARRDPSQPFALWTFHPISTNVGYSTFGHGLGVGDVNQDGRLDILFPLGYFEQPVSLANDPIWTAHLHDFGGAPGGAHMFAFDPDHDGDADVISARDAHGYGLSWFEQVPVIGTSDITFVAHSILPVTPSPRIEAQVSQLHAALLGDLDGDGEDDFITGKSYYAHNGSDPGANDPAFLVAFLTRRSGGTVTFEPFVIHDDCGIGRRPVLVDINRDGKADVVHAGKKGVWVHLQR